jgi:3-phosphoshikimate 1-carboxyvinyltransferase
LEVNGVSVRVDGDSLIVEGRRQMTGGGRVTTHLDHRIAMAFLTAGLASDKPIVVDDTSMIATSFPEFRGIMETLGARFEEAPEQ